MRVLTHVCVCESHEDALSSILLHLGELLEGKERK